MSSISPMGNQDKFYDIAQIDGIRQTILDMRD